MLKKKMKRNQPRKTLRLNNGIDSVSEYDIIDKNYTKRNIAIPFGKESRG